MKAEMSQYKYQRHSEKQYLLILSTAERLFIERGIDKVNLSDIARECGIMRSTFYRYFTNKEDIMWNILHQYAASLSEKILSRFGAENSTAYDRFVKYFDILYEVFIEDPTLYLFYNIFLDFYQNVTSSTDKSFYNRFFNEEEFRSGDTVKLLKENFNDGSIKPGLDSQTTTVTVVYSAMGILTSMSRQISTLPAKYGVPAETVVRLGLDALLESIKA